MSYKLAPQCLKNRRILLGMTGSIAAYKSADLTRKLVDSGAEVQVVMTTSAEAFITPLSMQAVSGRAVRSKLLDPEAEANGMGHIELARWAEYVLVAPATADFIANLAGGRANDLLSALCLATEAPVAVAPAMNRMMWQKPATKRNITQLQEDGILVLGPASGQQACGETGAGRMLEPQDLHDRLAGQLLISERVLADYSVLITAGPTQEPLDPVRFISNRSSGKQGFALAEACVQAGASVTLIAGPVHLPTPAGVHRIDVITAEEMHEVVLKHVPKANLFIGVAAVADYRPMQIALHKIKKTQEGTSQSVALARNPDIIAAVAALPNRPYVVGFAAETCDLEKYAKAKLVHKNLDMVIANDVSEKDSGFDSDNNKVVIITKQDETRLEKVSKSTLSRILVERIATAMNDISTSRQSKEG